MSINPIYICVYSIVYSLFHQNYMLTHLKDQHKGNKKSTRTTTHKTWNTPEMILITNVNLIHGSFMEKNPSSIVK